MTGLNKAIADIPLPDRLKGRPISAKGFPVPWFVTLKDMNGEWDFRILDPNRAVEAHRKSLCGICGQRLGVHKVFAIGPMCCVNRVSAEGPVHLECAQYAVKACPFMARPNARRNRVGIEGIPEVEFATPGYMIERNPGVTALWTTKKYKISQPDKTKGILFHIGDPEDVEWWASGRRASYDEVMTSVNTGLPFLQEAAQLDGHGAEASLTKMVAKAQPIFATAMAS